MMLLYYSLGNTLESYWGAFRYNVYIFSGILFTVIGAFIVNGLIGGITGFGSLYSTYYINMSIFLACASIMPDYQLLLYGIIPIKMKWLAILDVVLLAVDAVQGGLIIRIVIIASLLNFIIFFFCNRNLRGHSPKQAARRKKFQKQISRPQSTDVQCAVVLNLTIRHWSSVIVQSVTGIMNIARTIFSHTNM